jgi:anthranilate synthase component 1
MCCAEDDERASARTSGRASRHSPAALFGFFGYDAVRWFEHPPTIGRRTTRGMDTAAVMFFSSLLAFDHVKHQIQIIANVFTDGDRDG